MSNPKLSVGQDVPALLARHGYDYVAPLGEGGAGLVVKAYDRKRGLFVAAKFLRMPDGDMRVALKTEFRQLTTLAHRNIVGLYSLVEDSDVGFFTMEWVDGLDFLSYLKAPTTPGSSATRPGVDLQRAIDATLALVDALETVHDSGRLHRDVKPSNVLVTQDGRVVLLDFGLTTLFERNSLLSDGAGSPEYMAPEQVRRGALTPACDWYAVGAMLHAALFGCAPTSDTLADLTSGQAPATLSAGRLDDSCPTLLLELIAELQDEQASSRPPAAVIRATLAACAAELARSRASTRARFSPAGREAALRALQDCQMRAAEQGPQFIIVNGESGVGKTTLVQHFLDGLARDGRARGFRSRCHFQEIIKFPGLDGVVDELTERLRDLEWAVDLDIDANEYAALRRMFPAFERVPFRVAKSFAGETPDQFVVIDMVLARVCELLAQVAAHEPVVLWIDDYQWSDSTSAVFLQRVARSRLQRLTVILSHRTDALSPETSPASLAALFDSRALDLVPVTRIRLVALAPTETAQFFQDLSGRPAPPRADSDTLQQSTGGLPIFIKEVALYSGPGVRLDPSAALARRFESLTAAERNVLELAALCELPLSERAFFAIESVAADHLAAVTHMRKQNLLQNLYSDGEAKIFIYHDRIRQAVLGFLPQARRRELHARIAHMLESWPGAEKGELVAHYLGCQHFTRAARIAAEAAEVESSRLHFGSAADLLAVAIEHDDDHARRPALHRRRADALALAGRSRDAADEYLKVLATVDQARTSALELAQYKVLAAEQFLYAGLLVNGVDLLRDVFASLDLPFPRSERAALWMAISNRVRFALGTRRSPGGQGHDANDAALLRLDTLWVAAKSALLLDFVIGDAMASWYLRLAVEIGDPVRLLRAMGLESCIYANLGGRWWNRRADTLFARARALLVHSSAPVDRALILQWDAAMAWFRGHWQHCATVTDESIAVFRNECSGVQFDVAVGLGWGLSARAFLGDINAVREVLPGLLDDARKRGDEYFYNVFRSSIIGYLLAAVDDTCEAALVTVDGTLRNVPSNRFTSLHFHHLIAASNCYLYLGRPDEAWALLESRWQTVSRTGFLRLAVIGWLLGDIRARAALALARRTSGSTREAMLSQARQQARFIRRKHLPFAAATAASIDAGIAALTGARQQREQSLQVAIAGYRAASMPLHAAALQRVHAMEGADGADIAVADHFLSQQGVRAPDRLCQFVDPGFLRLP